MFAAESFLYAEQPLPDMTTSSPARNFPPWLFEARDAADRGQVRKMKTNQPPVLLAPAAAWSPFQWLACCVLASSPSNND